MSKQVQDVYDAWNDPGVNPNFHRAMQERVRRQWPALARALDFLPRPKEET